MVTTRKKNCSYYHKKNGKEEVHIDTKRHKKHRKQAKKQGAIDYKQPKNNYKNDNSNFLPINDHFRHKWINSPN